VEQQGASCGDSKGGILPKELLDVVSDTASIKMSSNLKFRIWLVELFIAEEFSP
jgi:hypothetical protein